MPRISQTVAVTTTAEVTLSPRLKQQLKVKLDEFARLRAEKKAIVLREEALKLETETLFADSGEYDALLEGVKVDGIDVNGELKSVPLKMVTGGTSKKFQKKLLLTRHKLTMAQVDALYKETPKADYLNIALPRDRDEAEDDDD